MRGLSADMLGIDEFQDVLSDNVPILREALTASDYKLLMYTGTPKTFDNHLEKEWQQSFQAVWVTRAKAVTRTTAWIRIGKLLAKTESFARSAANPHELKKWNVDQNEPRAKRRDSISQLQIVRRGVR